MEEERIESMREEEKQSEKSQKNEVQITISVEAERKLQEALSKVNHEFHLGRVTRKHLASHLLESAVNDLSPESIQAIQQSAITDMTLLDRLYKEAKMSGTVPQALRDLLWTQLNVTTGSKRTKRAGRSKHIIDMDTDESAA